MQKRERRLLKAEKLERKRKQDEAKGLRRVKDVNNDDESSSAYHTSNSDSQSEESAKEEEQLEEIFDMNEI